VEPSRPCFRNSVLVSLVNDTLSSSDYVAWSGRLKGCGRTKSWPEYKHSLGISKIIATFIKTLLLK
jgi:hypothetical protein